MALWYLVVGRVILRRVDAPDKRDAMARLRAKPGDRVVSAASYALDTEPRPKAEGSHRRKLRWDQRHRTLRNAQQQRWRERMTPERRERRLADLRTYSRKRWKRLHPNAVERPERRKSGPTGNGSGG